MLDQLDTIAGKTLTADALLTQRKLASYLLERNAHSLFTAKNNQPNLLFDIALHFATEGTRPPEFEEPPTLAHARIEQRAIWTTTALNHYLDFPGVGQGFMIRRTRHYKATGKTHIETAYGVTSHTPPPPTPNASSPSTGVTGASNTPPTTASTGPSTRTDAASAPDTAPRTPLACDASPSNSSQHARCPWPRPCDD